MRTATADYDAARDAIRLRAMRARAIDRAEDRAVTVRFRSMTADLAATVSLDGAR